MGGSFKSFLFLGASPLKGYKCTSKRHFLGELRKWICKNAISRKKTPENPKKGNTLEKKFCRSPARFCLIVCFLTVNVCRNVNMSNHVNCPWADNPAWSNDASLGRDTDRRITDGLVKGKVQWHGLLRNEFFLVGIFGWNLLM